MKTTPKIGISKKKKKKKWSHYVKKKSLVPIQLKLDSYHFGLLVESQALSDFLPPLQAQALLVFTQRKSREKKLTTVPQVKKAIKRSNEVLHLC